MIKKPEEMNFSDKNIIMIISGQPGTGKTSLGLSAPDVLLIDTDEGLARVNPEHRKDASICKTYEDVLSDIKEAEGHYKTIVIDTCGELIEIIKDWAVRTEPSAAKKSGGISMQGFGIVKQEFNRLSNELRKKFNVVYIFHASKDKTADDIFYDLVVEGSTKNTVWKNADLGAFLHIINGERYLGFTPTAQYNAKASYGIKGLVKVPELNPGDKNDFLTKLFAKVKENLANEVADLKPKQDAYEMAIAEGKKLIDAITEPDEVIPCLNAIKQLRHSLTSEKELNSILKVKIKENGWVYDKEAKIYVGKQ